MGEYLHSALVLVEVSIKVSKWDGDSGEKGRDLTPTPRGHARTTMGAPHT